MVITFQWLTHAAVTVDETAGTLVLRQSGETLCLRVSSTSSADTGALGITVEGASPLLAAYDAPNPGLKRILIQMESGGGTGGCITIEAHPGLASSTRVAPSPPRPLAAW